MEIVEAIQRCIESMQDDLRENFFNAVAFKVKKFNRARSERMKEHHLRDLIAVYQEFGIHVKMRDPKTH